MTMNDDIARRFIVVSLVWLVGLLCLNAPTRAHSGGTDEDGCHTCQTDCKEKGYEKGERHCHGDPSAEDSGEDPQADRLHLEDGERVYVDKVVDGDTLEVRVPSADGKRVDVRLLGIDCPESHRNPKCRRQGRSGGPGCAEQIPRGLKAAKAAADLVKHETVRLEAGEGGDLNRGHYGRILAYVRMQDGRDLGLTLIEQGLCRDYGHKYPHPRGEAYRDAEESDGDS
jgi:endonuclease YncB( thermonuclease family)